MVSQISFAFWNISLVCVCTITPIKIEILKFNMIYIILIEKFGKAQREFPCLFLARIFLPSQDIISVVFIYITSSFATRPFFLASITECMCASRMEILYMKDIGIGSSCAFYEAGYLTLSINIEGLAGTMLLAFFSLSPLSRFITQFSCRSFSVLTSFGTSSMTDCVMYLQKSKVKNVMKNTRSLINGSK